MARDKVAELLPLVQRLNRKFYSVKFDDGPRWVDAQFTKAKLEGHLSGKGKPCGLVPIEPGKSVTSVGVIDFDSHKGETPWDEMCNIAAGVGQVLLEMGCVPHYFRSTGGRGIHLYVMWKDPQDAHSVRCLLADALDAIGMKNGTKGVAQGEAEIFPKQAEVAIDGYGSMFILPLAQKSVFLEMVDAP